MRIRLVAAAAAASLGIPAAAVAFDTNDPLAPRQWYLEQDRAFDAWADPPALRPVRVAVIDSGVDGRHREFAGRISAARSFVDRSALRDRDGHGTFVAGEIAAATGNGQGISGIAFSATLVIAKVVRRDGTVPPDAEARAIRWAVARGARVISLSLGATRDPLDPLRDMYSPLEQSAIEHAVRRGAVVVAAVGNGGQDGPWPFASYPAALPHVVGVSAFERDGSVPAFSNRDPIYNDVSAPGTAIFSTFPRRLTARFRGCREQGYSSCAPVIYRRGDGTSFAAPQVAAAAALLLSVRPSLRPDQVSTLIERTAADAAPGNGCDACRGGRDSLTGWGRLDVAAAVKALQRAVPVRDRLEPNDDAGRKAAVFPRIRRLRATIDFWDDPVDVYRVRLRRGQRLIATLDGRSSTDPSLTLWKPGTRRVFGRAGRLRAAHSSGPGGVERIEYRAGRGGWYYVEVAPTRPGGSSYTLELAR